jgi:uncharacterized membrane protein HdeD (DUF308 family)
MSMGPNPYAPGQGGMMGGAPPQDVEKKAGNMQLMGILSIVFGICCPLIGLILSIMVMTQAGGATAAAQQYGAQHLVSKIATGKTCAIIGLVISIINMIAGVAINLGGLANQ